MLWLATKSRIAVYDVITPLHTFVCLRPSGRLLTYKSDVLVAQIVFVKHMIALKKILCILAAHSLHCLTFIHHNEPSLISLFTKVKK